MLKLVVTDMDGTFLNGEEKIPERAFPLIKKLHEKGVKFAVATGRQYNNVMKLYEDFDEEIIVMSDNGGIMYDDGEKTLLNAARSREELEQVIQTVRSIDGARLALAGVNSAYVFASDIDDKFSEEINFFFETLTMIDSLDDIPEDELIFTICVNHRDGSEKNLKPYFAHLEDKYKIVVSNPHWIDMMNPYVNKGRAVKMIQEKYDISYEETMVFGDYLNDVEMMQTAHYSYAMDNAHPDLKKIANFIAPSNVEEGVISVLENFLSMAFKD